MDAPTEAIIHPTGKNPTDQADAPLVTRMAFPEILTARNREEQRALPWRSRSLGSTQPQEIG